MATFRLRFPLNEIEALAARFDFDTDDHVATEDEAERMAALCVLRGVEAPTASVLLHFAFPDRYPMIDWRALESLGQREQATYPIKFWRERARR